MTLKTRSGRELDIPNVMRSDIKEFPRSPFGIARYFYNLGARRAIDAYENTKGARLESALLGEGKCK